MADNSKYDKHGQHSLLGIDSVDGQTEQVKVEPDAKALRVATFVFDADTLSNVRMTQPLTNVDDLESISNGIYFGDMRLEYSGSNPIYIGYHLINGAATSDSNWWIKKLTYSGENVIRIQTTQGAYSDKENLF